jgi:hypothetical protein
MKKITNKRNAVNARFCLKTAAKMMTRISFFMRRTGLLPAQTLLAAGSYSPQPGGTAIINKAVALLPLHLIDFTSTNSRRRIIFSGVIL